MRSVTDHAPLGGIPPLRGSDPRQVGRLATIPGWGSAPPPVYNKNGAWKASCAVVLRIESLVYRLIATVSFIDVPFTVPEKTRDRLPFIVYESALFKFPCLTVMLEL
jgi:hypothetical protein